MSDDTDSWLQNAFGFNIAEAAQNVVEAVAPAVQSVEQAVAPVVQEVAEAVTPMAQSVEEFAAPALQTVADAGVSFSQSVQSSIQGRIDGVVDGVRGIKDAGTALVAPIPDEESGGDAAFDLLHRGYNMAKSVYTGVGAIKDAIVPPNPFSAVASMIPDANTVNRKLSEGVDAVEEMAKGNSALYATAQVVGGVVKGVGDMAAMTSNMIVHPLDTGPKVFEGMEGIVEHTHLPGTDGLKVLHGLYDIATDNKQGKYGSTLEEVNKHINDGTERDSSDPSKWIDSDVEFGASFGGGIKAWEDKPIEAAARTITNIAPMLFGEAKGIPSEGLPAVAGEVPVVPELPRAGVPEPIPAGEVRGAPATEAGPAALDPQSRAFAEADTELPEPIVSNVADAPPKSPVDEIPSADAQPNQNTPAQSYAEAEQNYREALSNYRKAHDVATDAHGESIRYSRDQPGREPHAGYNPDPDWSLEDDRALDQKYFRAAAERQNAQNAFNEAQKRFQEFGGEPIKGNPLVTDMPKSTVGRPGGTVQLEATIDPPASPGVRGPGGTAKFESPRDLQSDGVDGSPVEAGDPPTRGPHGTLVMDPPGEMPGDIADGVPLQPQPVIEVGPGRGPHDTVVMDRPVDPAADLADGPPLQADPIVDVGPGRGPHDTVVMDRPVDPAGDLADGPPLQADPIVEVGPGRGPRDTLVMDRPVEPAGGEIADNPPIVPDPVVDVPASPVEQPGSVSNGQQNFNPAFEEARQAYVDALAEAKSAEAAKIEATRDLIRFNSNRPGSDPDLADGRIWSASEAKELLVKAQGASYLSRAMEKLADAAQKAFKAQMKSAGVKPPIGW